MFEKEKTFPSIETISINEDFNFWIDKKFITSETKKKLEEANLILIPREGFRDRTELNFPINTGEFLQYLKNNSKEGLVADICIEDENYHELALHSEWLIIANIIIKDFILPVYLGILSNYLYSKWGNKTEEKNIKMQITIEKKKTTYKIKYEGPANAFKKYLSEEVKKLGDKE